MKAIMLRTLKQIPNIKFQFPNKYQILKQYWFRIFYFRFGT